MTSLSEIWAADLLNRKMDGLMLEGFLVRRHAERTASGVKGAYVLNLNAGWGVGKTFFLDRFHKQLVASGHPVAFVNAWKDDASQEPAIAVMAAIEESLKPYLAKRPSLVKSWSTAKAKAATIIATLVKGAARKAATRYLGEAVDELKELFEHSDTLPAEVEAMISEGVASGGEALSEEISTLLTQYVDEKLEAYQARIDSSHEFQRRMASLLDQLSERDDVKLPFFVLIDELDRCRPTYAIEMLEQVKHLFDIDNVVFVIATDSDQLSHSVCAVYGQNFDGSRYLNRFFNRHYRFEQRDLSVFVEYLFASHGIDESKLLTPKGSTPVSLFVALMKAKKVTLRDADQCFDILRSVVTLWGYDVPIHLVLILPLILMMHSREYERMDEFVISGIDHVPEWTFEIEYWQISKAQAMRVVGANKFIKELLAAANANEMDQTSNNSFQRYAQQAFRDEIAVFGTAGGVRPASLMLEYPAIVRQVGRLAAPADEGSLETIN